jgi:hypothetical protein
MAFNPFIGWSETDLLAERLKCQREMLEGGALTAGGAGGTSFSRAPQFSAMTRLRWIQVALNAINATTYPLSDLQPQSQMPNFYQSDPNSNAQRTSL